MHTHFSYIYKFFEEIISLVHDRIIKGLLEIINECETNFYILCLFYTFISNRMYIGVSQTDKTTYFLLLYDTRFKWHQRQNQIIMNIIWIYKNVRKFFFFLFCFVLFGLLIYKQKSELIWRRPTMSSLCNIIFFS